VVDSNGSLPRRIRVLVVDDYVGVRHAIATAVATFTDLELAGQASNTEEAIRLCECNRPDVILMDVSLPGIGGAAATSVILYPLSPECREWCVAGAYRRLCAERTSQTGSCKPSRVGQRVAGPVRRVV
jgi:response regulator RpfG family c-di-GMP phosphodiesterase